MQKDKIHSTDKKNKEACCGKDKSTKRQEQTTEEPRMPLSVKMIERNNKKKTPKAALHKLPGKSSLNFSFVFPVCPVIPDICHFSTLAKFLENKIYTEKRQFLNL